MDVDLFGLERFVTAQNTCNSYELALKEIKDGRKRSCWMWFVFPQIQGLGHSRMSQQYSIKSLLEAKAYLEDDTLGQRLYDIMNALTTDKSANEIFGRLNAMKLRSCLTLFDIVSPDEIFAEFLDYYFNKERCKKTLRIVLPELIGYREECAFSRNGVIDPPRAFFESGTHESMNIEVGQKIGTLLDLSRRGYTMRTLLSSYLWHKDFSYYRLSGIKNTLIDYMRIFFIEISENANDKEFFNKMNDIYCKYQFADTEQVFMIADALDEFLLKYGNDSHVTPIIDAYLEDSLCKETLPDKGRVYHGKSRPYYTPADISYLHFDEIFVFGSDLQGSHDGGVARTAYMRFGAIMGKGVGLHGQTYAIPTMPGGVDTIKPYVDQFIAYAKRHPEFFFYVSRIGCDIAGFKDSDIAPLFARALNVKNICLPLSFVREITAG